MFEGISWEALKECLELSYVRVGLVAAAALLVLFISRLVTRKIVAHIDRPEEGDDREWELRAKTLIRVVNGFVGVTIIIVALFLILMELGVQIGPLVAAAGIAGLAIGFGAQSLVKDFICGFFMLLENQYRVGDVIKVGGVEGYVEKLTLRVTVLRDLNGVVHFIPNGSVTRVSNETYGWSRMVVDVDAPFKQKKADAIIDILKSVCADFHKDEQWRDVLLEEPQVLGIEAMTDTRVTVRIIGKTKPLKQWDAMRELRRRIRVRFDREGV